MQPKTRNGTGRQLKMTGSDSDSVPSPNPPRKMPKNTSSRVVDRKSPPTPASEKKRSSKVSEMESQLAHLQEELKKVKDHLNSSESSKKWAHQEAEAAKRQLAYMSDQLQESQKQLIEISAAEDGRILELRKISQDRDRAWQSELEVLQTQHKMDSTALAFANNVISKLRLDLKESLNVIDELKSQLKHSEDLKATLPEGLEANDACKPVAVEVVSEISRENHENLEELKEELSDVKSEVERLKSALDLADKRYREEYIQSTFQIRSAYELFERSKSESSIREAELESKLKMATAKIEALEAMESKKDQMEEGKLESKNLEGDLEDLKASLLDKEKELQCMTKENEMFKLEIEKRNMEEKDEAVNLADSEREAEMRRLKIQSDQWRKAAEVATAMLSNGNNDKFVDGMMCIDNSYHTIGGKLNLPFSEDMDEEVVKKKNATMLKKIGVLLKKGQK